MRLKIQRFDPEKQLKDHRICLILGRRGTGKSVLLQDILYHMRDRVDFGLAMTPTNETADMFRTQCGMPDSWVYDGFSTARLEQMTAFQRATISAKKTPRSLFVVADDCGFDRSVLKGKAIRDMFMNGRHNNMCFISCMQYCMDITPDLRTQIDYVFCLRESIISNKMKLWKSFFGMFERYDEFSSALDRCTENYSCLVLDQTAPTSRIEDCVYWYRARVDVPPFRIGKPIFHKLAARHAKSEQQQRREAEVRIVGTAATDKRITHVTRTDSRGRTIPEDRSVVCE